MSASSWCPRTLALAAASGLAMAANGCKQEQPQNEAGHAATSASIKIVAAETKAKECCIGKNDCKGKGGCAVPESHACAGKNDCKGKGGCNMHCPQ
jgi:hypothetical protein